MARFIDLNTGSTTIGFAGTFSFHVLQRSQMFVSFYYLLHRDLLHIYKLTTKARDQSF